MPGRVSESALQNVVVCDLGLADYEQVWRLQARIQKRLIEAKRQRSEEQIPHVMLTVEHPPVFTLGKSGNAGNVLLSQDELTRRGAKYYEIDRGGDITFHGPGQQVVYPILDLDRFFTDIHRYLRELEEAVIRTCAEYGIAAGRVEGRTGVWVGPDSNGPERKICAMGIRCSRWVTMHGLAFNVNTDLGFFSMIVPCGIADRGVTSLASELGREIDLGEARLRLIRHIGSRFGMQFEHLSGNPALAFLDTFLDGHGLFTGA